MIDARDVIRGFVKDGRILPVLTGASLRVTHGEFVAIQGQSGCGKTTLLNVLGCLDVPTGGSYRFDGTDVGALNDDARSGLRNNAIGFVFQQFHLLERLSALRNVALPLLYVADDAGDVEERAHAALATVGMSHRASHTPAELSGGEQQRVAIARALVNDPMVILADEPTGNLDPEASRTVMDVLGSLCASGRTIVLATHDPYVAQRAGRRVMLAAGRVTEAA